MEYVQVFNTDHSRHETLMPMTNIDACPIHSIKGSNNNILSQTDSLEYPGSTYASENKKYQVPATEEDGDEKSYNLIIIGVSVILVFLALIVGIFVGEVILLQVRFHPKWITSKCPLKQIATYN